MEQRYFLIQTAPKKEGEVYSALIAKPCILEAHLIKGEYDIIAKGQAENNPIAMHDLEISIRSVPGVIGTKDLGEIVKSSVKAGGN